MVRGAGGAEGEASAKAGYVHGGGEQTMREEGAGEVPEADKVYAAGDGVAITQAAVERRFLEIVLDFWGGNLI